MLSMLSMLFPPGHLYQLWTGHQEQLRSNAGPHRCQETHHVPWTQNHDQSILSVTSCWTRLSFSLYVKNMLVIGLWTVLEHVHDVQILRASQASQGRFQTECLMLCEFQFRLQSIPRIAFLDPRVALLVVPLIVISIISGITLVQVYQAIWTCAIVHMWQLRTVPDSGEDSCIVLRFRSGSPNVHRERHTCMQCMHTIYCPHVWGRQFKRTGELQLSIRHSAVLFSSILCYLYMWILGTCSNLYHLASRHINNCIIPDCLLYISLYLRCITYVRYICCPVVPRCCRHVADVFAEAFCGRVAGWAADVVGLNWRCGWHIFLRDLNVLGTSEVPFAYWIFGAVTVLKARAKQLRWKTEDIDSI